MKTLLSHTTISARMIMLALLTAVLTLGIGLFGVLQTSKVNDMLNGLYEHNLTPITDIANANMQAIYHHRSMYIYIAEADAAEMAKLLDGKKKNEERMTALLDKYRKTELTPKEKEALAAFDAAWPPYKALAERAMKMTETSQDQQAQALAMATDQVAPLFQKADDALSTLVELNIALAKQAYDESDQVVGDSRTMSWIVIAIAVLASVGGALLISRSITRPLGGEPAAVVDAANAIAEGDLSRTIAVRPGDTTSVVARMAVMQQNLAQVVAGVRQNAEGVAAASTQIAQGNNDLSGRTEEQASALQQTAASMEELTTTVKLNADNARQANELAKTASTVARQGGEVVGRVVGTMKEINDSSTRIADIISVIDGIAFQTNILALNAAVEAARAGEQGRGFAVVAGEVRTLAGRSAEAAKEIKGLITASVERVSAGSQLVDQAGTTMQEVVQSIGRVNQIMGDISNASEEQSAGVAQIGQAVMQMDQATQQNAALVEESAAAADNLRHQAGDLLQSVAVFRLGGDTGLVAAPAGPTAPAAVTRAAAPRPAAPRAVAPRPASPPRAALQRPASATAGAPKPAAPRSLKAAPAPAPHARALATTGAEDDWTSF
jgi:methyl-accepting chemotaxis protein